MPGKIKRKKTYKKFVILENNTIHASYHNNSPMRNRKSNYDYSIEELRKQRSKICPINPK